jgi:competence protein ComFC
MRTLLNTILDIIFPISCISCKESGVILCPKCISSSPESEKETPDWVFPVFDYRHPPIKKAIWFLKYKGKRSLAKIFADTMYPRILEEISDMKMLENFIDPILIPIPITKKRLRERGFNQTTLICNELVRLDKNNNFILEKYILSKIKNGEHQARIENRNMRLKNIIGSFAIINREIIKNRNIILIDDVTTTGATLNEARKVLKQAGAKKIIAFTVAH